MNKVVSLGKSTYSMATKGTCILLVNEDIACNKIVHETLQHCHHEVLHIGGLLDVLNAIWERRNTLDLVLTNVHKLESNGREVIHHIQKKLNLLIVLMCPDKSRITSKGQPFSFAAYVLNGLSRNDVNNLWQHALKKESSKLMASYHQENEQESSMGNIRVKTNKTHYSSTRFNERAKKKEPMQKIDEEDPNVAKKPRVVWTMEMHQKFLEAIEIIGYDKAVPKKIVEVMGIPGLTRENVASHLQKFRGNIKRIQETAYGNGTTNLSIGLSVSRFNNLQNNTTPLWQTSRVSRSEESLTTTLVAKFQQQKHVITPQTCPNHRIYGDQTRSMLLRISENSPFGGCNESNTSKYVGYRLTGDGNSIEFGGFDGEINKESLVSSSGTFESQSTGFVKKVYDSCQEFDSFSLRSPSIQEEKLENATPSQNLFENDILVQNATSTDRDYLMPSLEISGNEDLLVQNLVSFSEGASEGHYSPSSWPETFQHLDDFLDIEEIDTWEKYEHKHDD